MGKVIELRPRDPLPPQEGRGEGPASDPMRRLIGSVCELVRVLEESHRRIRALIEQIPDPEVSARLARDHAALSAALRDAKEKVAALAMEESAPGD